ncbi:hypothetical protein MM_3364 [Methanosarcina mazei Go1]|uniref:Uncharacterized protein n=1 Tax=Methanosarcina mazei (strain ATCC BAA-159 / DSM 3647 / Goe1 / Go1 / JCM 11833 / OCM 88) TaxID=192952 RepID=Q8PRS9_METMA|nr:hypothetical protein MM_3364 [Methanosarcina mazei Go1]
MSRQDCPHSRRDCFNPCFSGSCSRIWFWLARLIYNPSCFNPCFSGSCSRMFFLRA